MQSKGFTLLEVLVTLVMAALLLGLAAGHTSAALRADQASYERDILRDQLDSALDLMEDDLRRARDIDRSDWVAGGNDLAQLNKTPELHLLVADPGRPGADARIRYLVRVPQDGGRNPADRPRVRATLYRTDTSGDRSGNKEPVTSAVASGGLSVRYYDRDGAPCGLDRTPASVEIVLTAFDKSGGETRRSRLIPLNTAAKGGQ